MSADAGRKSALPLRVPNTQPVDGPNFSARPEIPFNTKFSVKKGLSQGTTPTNLRFATSILHMPCFGTEMP